MKLVVNARFLTQPMTGVQRFAVEICVRLKRLCNEIEFVAPNGIVQKDNAELLGVTIIGKHQGHLWEQFDLPQYLRSKGCPLLLCLCNTAPVFYRNKAVAVHDITFIRYPKTYTRSFVLFYRMLVPLIISTSKHLFTVSNFSRSELLRYYNVDEREISVIYNAVSGQFTNVRPPKRQSKPYFLAVSSVKENKNFLYIIDAFKRFTASNASVHLYIIGDINNKSFQNLDLFKHIGSADRIEFLGRVSDAELISYYCDAEAFLFPSLYEGFGIPPLEAQACNCPVICSNASCLPEVFSDSVLYCNPTDPDTLVRAMEQIVSDSELKNALISKGRNNVMRYSWDKSAEKLLADLSLINSKS